MPFSQSSQLSAIVGFIEQVQPLSILDVGVGMGQYGFLARNNLEQVNLFRIEGDRACLRPRSEWRVRIDGIEAFPGYLTPVHDYAYNRIIIGNALEELPALADGAYDLVLAVDILEHFTPADGRRFLSEVKRVAKRAALVSTPKDFYPQEVAANPYENHRSHWTARELADAGFGEVLDNPVSWIAVHRRAGAQEAEQPPAGATREVGWASPADEAPLLELFSHVFGHAMPPAQWRWKYAGLDPLGSVVRRHGRVIAFYGGMPREIRWFGSPMTAVQIGDVMVEPAERAVLTRRGPFFLAATAFAERLVGPGRPYAFAFGFPSERHTRLGERLGLYARVDEVLEAKWAPLPARPGLLHKARPLTRERLSVVDALWQKMADRLTGVVIGVRDAKHINHRFLDHPAAAYLCLLVTQRLTGAAIGLVVVRDRGEAGVELVDVVGPPESFPGLVAVARRVAGRLRRAQVFAWMTPRAADSFAACSPQLAPAGIPIPTIIWSAAPDLERLRGRWWLLGGDADSR